MVETTNANPVTFQGGFLTFPGGTFAPDPRGKIVGVIGLDALKTAQSPILTGRMETGPPFYDAALNRWIPAGAGQSSADGAAYAYSTIGDSISAGATIHVVSVASGTERTFKIAIPDVGAAAGLGVEDFDGSGVYFGVEQVENYPAGVWRLDLGSGNITALAQVANVFAVRDGYAWIGYVDPHDPNPPSAPASVHFFDSLVQVKLTTGARTTWFYRPGVAVTLFALDGQGRPVVYIDDGPDPMQPATTELRRLTEPLSGGEDNGELISSGQVLIDHPQPDGDRIWFGNERGIYLYALDRGLLKVYAHAAPGQVLFPAGFCR